MADVVPVLHLLLILLILFTLYHLWMSLVSFFLVVIFVHFTNYFIIEHCSHNVVPRGKFVLITGCDSGFGLEIAVAAATAGLNVIACCLNKTSAVSHRLRNANSAHFRIFKLDVTNDENVHHVLEQVTKMCGKQGLWALVNNAGVWSPAPIEVTSLDTITRECGVLLMGAIRVTKAFLPLVRRAQGRVISISCAVGMLCPPNMAGYCIAKHGLEAFSDCLRMEMKKFNVHVALIEPSHFVAATAIMSRESTLAWLERMNRDLKFASAEVKSTYGPLSIAEVFNWFMACRKSSALSARPVVKATLHAILNTRPNVRYVVAGTNRPVDALVILLHCKPYLPDTLKDWILNKIFKV